MSALVLATVLYGCVGEPEATLELSLDGPARVRVDTLGAVDGPGAVLTDGTQPEGVEWTVSDESVARVDGDDVFAEAPGEVTITGTWQEQAVSWTLVVDPAMVLMIAGAPPSLAVGDMRRLRALGTIGEESVDPGAVSWSSSDSEILEVTADGTITALGPGRVWVSAKNPAGAESMVEVDVQ